MQPIINKYPLKQPKISNPNTKFSRKRVDHINNPEFQTINECQSDNDRNTLEEKIITHIR